MDDRVLSLLGLMRKASAVEPGEDRACEALQTGKAKFMLLSNDVSPNARRHVDKASQGKKTPIITLEYDRQTIGASIGLNSCAMLAVTDLGFANALAKRLCQLKPQEYSQLAANLQLRQDKAQIRKKRKTEGSCKEKGRTVHEHD